MNIAIIPARGGSKRIPRKNIKMFAGKPMISYAIDIAKKSGFLTEIFVSTEDLEIAKISKQYGAQVINRPIELADDYTPINPVIVHAIKVLETIFKQKINRLACIYPCVPLIQVDDLLSANKLLSKLDIPNLVFTITEFQSSVQRALSRNEIGQMSPMYPENLLIRSQDLEKAYYDAGQFCIGTREAWISSESALQGGVGLLIPSWRSVDIDTPDDWIRAELIYQTIKLGQKGGENAKL